MFDKKADCGTQQIIRDMEQARQIARASLKNVDNKLKVLCDKPADSAFNYAVDFFLNNHSLELNQDVPLQEQLLDAWQNGQWERSIMFHPKLQHLAYALFADDKLSSVAFETMIRRFHAFPAQNKSKISQNITNNHQIIAHKLLDESGNLTPEANKWLLPFAKDLHGNILQKDSLKNFLFLMRAFIEIHPEENVFFLVKNPYLAQDKLLFSLYLLNAVPMPDKESFLVFSCLIEDAFQLARASLDDMFYGRLMAGKIDINTIEWCNHEQIRPLAVSGFGLPENDSVHEFLPGTLSPFSKMRHDIFHSLNCTIQGKKFHTLWRHLKNIARHQIVDFCSNIPENSAANSALIWHLTDTEFKYFSFNNCTDESMEVIFCKVFDNEFKGNIYFFHNKKITDFGIATFIDMVINAEHWNDVLQFNPEKLVGKYKKYYDIAMHIREYLQDDLPINILIFRAWLAFDATHFPVVMKYLASSSNEIQENVEFIRNNKTQFLGLINKKAGKLDEHSLSFTLLQGMEYPENIAENIDKETYKQFIEKENNFIKNIVLLHLYFSDLPALYDDLATLRDMVLSLKKIGNDSLKDLFLSLKTFYNAQKNTSSLFSNEIELEIITKVSIQVLALISDENDLNFSHC